MPRTKRQRTVCELPRFVKFFSTDAENFGGDAVVMTVEEYEAVRLIDKVGMTQEECAKYMQVARTTVQQTYADARRKMAELLVEGRPLLIAGGDYRLCDGRGRRCGYCRCRRGRPDGDLPY